MENKVFIDEMNRAQRLIGIINFISNSKEPVTIADITKKLQINRSTLRHYLAKLIQEEKIYYERRDDLQGRPTFVHINKKTSRRQWEEMKQKAEEYDIKMNADPITNEIISFLKHKKKATPEDIIEHIKNKKFDDMYVSKVLMSLQYLKQRKKVFDEWRIIQ